MQYLSYSGGARAADLAAADLLTRVTGRFYTPAPIGEPLAAEVARSALAGLAGQSEVRVIDPFCGDGRLVRWFLQAAADIKAAGNLRWDVHLWDNDDSALAIAAKDVRSQLDSCGAVGNVTTQKGDSFARAPNHRQSFDVVITNPPWDRLKPDVREFALLSKKTADAHLHWLRAQSKLLASLYPWSVPSRQFGGWGINLARCGVELSLGLLRPHGWSGVVTPASLFADQVSTQLRQWFFRRFAVRSIAYFPAETKLFESVDQPSATFVAQAVPPHSVADVRVYDRNLKHEDFKIDPSLTTAQTGYTLPIHGPMSCLRLLEQCSKLPRFSSLELDTGTRLWAGRELDETRHKFLLRDRGSRPFVKGRMVGRFGLVSQPQHYIAQNPEIPLPSSVSHSRLVWRDVSRPTQARRMQAALIPPGWVTGNSLNVAHFVAEGAKLLRTLLAVLNSFAFEIQIRALSATAHVSLGTVRQAAVPDLHDQIFVRKMEPLVDRRIGGDQTVEPALEALVARAYGFNTGDFNLLLSGFPKLQPQYRTSLRDAFAKM